MMMVMVMVMVLTVMVMMVVQLTVLMFMFCQSAKRAVFDGSFLGGNMSLVAQLDGRV